MQTAEESAAMAAEYVPFAQNEHAADPFVLLYFPASHAVHAVAGPVYPGPHVAGDEAFGEVCREVFAPLVAEAFPATASGLQP